MRSRQIEFADLYETHVADVYGFLAYRTRSRELTEDLTQATFERALRAWSRFDRRRASERTWLLVIARNLLIDHQRKHVEELRAEIDDHTLPAVDGPGANLGVSPLLIAALEKLNERDRDVVALRYGADLTGPEIADLTGLSLANVQQILSRSLRRLRELLHGSEAELRE